MWALGSIVRGKVWGALYLGLRVKIHHHALPPKTRDAAGTIVVNGGADLVPGPLGERHGNETR